MEESSPQPDINYRGLSRTVDVVPCTLDVADLRRLFSELDERAKGGVELQLANFDQPAEASEKEYNKLLEDARSASGVTLVINGEKGEQIVSRVVSTLEREKLPDSITHVVFDSELAFRQKFNFAPENRFRLQLDFTEPPTVNEYDPWSTPTPNNSSFEISGANETWVEGVHRFTTSFLDNRKSRRGWLHSPVVFNLLNWLLGIPASIWLVYRGSGLFSDILSPLPAALSGGVYIYFFLLSLFGLRMLVGGLRWVYPLIELEGTRSWKIRAAAGLVLISLMGALLYDLVKVLAKIIR